MEICSGKALLSRCLRFGADLRIGAVDLEDWSGESWKNPLDMTTPAGMASIDSTNYIALCLPWTRFSPIYVQFIMMGALFSSKSNILKKQMGASIKTSP